MEGFVVSSTYPEFESLCSDSFENNDWISTSSGRDKILAAVSR